MMLFKQFEPSREVSSFIECYWVVENKCTDICREKIIPDGFPEVIFHYKAPYRINIDGNWQTQSKNLMAGQLRNHFFLENTGESGMVGIKFKQTGLTRLFDLHMKELTDKVVPLASKVGDQLNDVITLVGKDIDPDEKILEVDKWLVNFTKSHRFNDVFTERVVNFIIDRKGMIAVKDLTSHFDISERKLERVFDKFVGLSPKFFSRIIRFNYLFKLMKEKKHSWTDLAFSSGFFDQSHFIKNFREFTGEDPSRYLFDQQNMANFFLYR